MTANDTQIGGTHYKDYAIQPWDYIIANDIPFLEGNAIKYITRWRQKGGLKDIKKAIHCLDKLVEAEEMKQKEQQKQQTSWGLTDSEKQMWTKHKYLPELPDSYKEYRE